MIPFPHDLKDSRALADHADGVERSAKGVREIATVEPTFFHGVLGLDDGPAAGVDRETHAGKLARKVLCNLGIKPRKRRFLFTKRTATVLLKR